MDNENEEHSRSKDTYLSAAKMEKLMELVSGVVYRLSPLIILRIMVLARQTHI